MSHTTLGYPHWVGCLGPSAVLTSRPHSLIVWAPQSYVDRAWVGELLLFWKASCQTGLGTTISPLFPRMGLCFPARMPLPSFVSTHSSWTGA